jgi:hypothetical protein
VKRGPSDQTRKIVEELQAEAERDRQGKGTRGFRKRLAAKYGITRQRVTQIAKSYGVDDEPA